MNDDNAEIEEIDEEEQAQMREDIAEWTYFTDIPGTKGEIKEQVNDFIVEELASHDTGEGDHLVVKLRKQNMTTMEAISKLSNMLHISKDRIGYAGNKDKRAVTEQYISIQGVTTEEVNQVFTDEFDIEVVGKNGYIGLGNLDANRFEITVRQLGLPKEDLGGRTEKIIEELDGKFPNYFGRQRFGSQRPITHQVGRHILRGEYEEAVWTYIAKPYDQEYKSIRKIRDELWETRDPEDAAEKFPKQYRYEKALLYHLTKNPEDYKGALKRLPEGLQRLFVHAYQSWVFNRVLSDLIDEGWHEPGYEIPLVGYKTDLKDEKPENKSQKILEEEGVSQEDFRLQDFPELRSEGTYRRAFADFRNFGVLSVDEDDLNMSMNKMRVKFDLPKGSYATMLLREVMKSG